MARINIEDTLFKDTRFVDLAVALGSKRAALGAVTEAFIVAQEFWYPDKRRIPHDEVKKQKLAPELVACGLAVEHEDGWYISGSEAQFQWLFDAQKRGHASAEARKAKTGSAQPKRKSKTFRKHLESVSEPFENISKTTEPLSLSLSPSLSLSSSSSSDSRSEEGSGGVKPAPSPELNRKIWDAYETAYQTRYGVEPSRNASVNSLIAQLGRRLGADAVEVVRFYLAHNKAYYVQTQHTVGPLVKDAESLHTQWKRGQVVLGSQAREMERMQHNADAFAQAAERIRARSEANRG